MPKGIWGMLTCAEGFAPQNSRNEGLTGCVVEGLRITRLAAHSDSGMLLSEQEHRGFSPGTRVAATRTGHEHRFQGT